MNFSNIQHSLTDATGTSRPQLAMLPPQTGNEPPPSTSNPNLITNWHARGAWMDWKRIDFPDTFAFPSGTNLLTGVTLMSYGALRNAAARSAVDERHHACQRDERNLVGRRAVIFNSRSARTDSAGT